MLNKIVGGASLLAMMFALGCASEHESVRDMVAHANFEPYIFSPTPSWSDRREITDLPDILTTGGRYLIVSYAAKDGREIFLEQSATANRICAAALANSDPAKVKLVYSSVAGVKAWHGPLTDDMARKKITQLARARVSRECVGYQIETPLGTFPFLSVNGALTDAELHALVDSLIPAKEYLKSFAAPAAAGAEKGGPASP